MNRVQGMKVRGLIAFACAAAVAAVAPLAGAQQATADAPAMCWTYKTLGDGAASRFGLKGSVDDAILSRMAFYTLTKQKAKVSSPFGAGASTWFKVELRAEAEGASSPVSLSGLLVELENPIVSPTTPGITHERHTDEKSQVHSLTRIALEARFKAGDVVVAVPFKSQGADTRRQKIDLRIGYPLQTWPVGKKPEVDTAANQQLVNKIDAAWKAAGALTIELALADGTVVATSDALSYIGDKAAAEFARLNGRAGEMIRGGKCQFLSD